MKYVKLICGCVGMSVLLAGMAACAIVGGICCGIYKIFTLVCNKLAASCETLYEAVSETCTPPEILSSEIEA